MSDLRKCSVNGKIGIFHCWEHYATVAAPSLMVGGHSGGQISQIFAIVEFPDGTVKRVEPYDVRFESQEEND